MLERLDEVPWAELTHAYGSAEDVPALLRAVASPDNEAREKALHALYGNIFHQGSRYEASRYAVPFLVELAENRSVAARDEILYLLVDLAVGYQESWLQSGFDADFVRRQWADVSDEDNKWLLDEVRVYEAVCGFAPVIVTLAEDDPDPHVRRAAVYTLAFLPDGAEHSLPGLERIIGDSVDMSSLANALLAIGTLRSSLQQDIASDARIRIFLEHSEPLVRFAAASACARVAASNDDVDREAVEVLLAILEDPGALEGSGLRWNAGDLVGLAWESLEVAVSEFDVPLVQRACEFLRAAQGLHALTLAGVLLRKLFPTAVVPDSADELSLTQRTLLHTLAEQPKIWTVGGVDFGNFSLLVTGHGLPGGAEPMARYLNGAPLNDCRPPGLRKSPRD